MPSWTNTQKGLREGGKRCSCEATSPSPQDPGCPSGAPAPTTHPGPQAEEPQLPCEQQHLALHCPRLPQELLPAPEFRASRSPDGSGAQSSKGTGTRARSPRTSSHSTQRQRVQEASGFHQGHGGLGAPHREPHFPPVKNCPSLPWLFSLEGSYLS